MRKVFYLFSLFVLLFSANGLAQRVLPSSVQDFFEEQMWSGKSGMNQYNRYVSPRLIDGVEMVDAFIAIDNERTLDALESQGVIVNSLFDGFVTAQIPVERLAAVSALPGVNDVEVSLRAELCTDSTMSVTHAGQVINGKQNGLPHNFNGKGVIIGVIDKGFDFQHRAFRSNDDVNKTRIVRVYDTQVSTGHPVYYRNSKLPGSVFMGDEIYSLTTDDNTGTHGTHTASIAAGSHVNGYGGMAPAADIILCPVSRTDGSLSVVELANCARYIKCYADSMGKPCVMSLSISVPGGQHDGNDYLSKAIAQVTGPGRIFVIAAGNTAGRDFYAYKQISTKNPLNLLFYCKPSSGMDSTYYYKSFQSELWMRTQWKRFDFKFHVLDKTTGRIVWESPLYNDAIQLNASDLKDFYSYESSTDTVAYIKVTRKTSSDGKKSLLSVSLRNLMSQQYTTVNGRKVSRYAIGMTAFPQTDDLTCDADAWVCNSSCSFGTYDNPVMIGAGLTSVQSAFYYTPGNDLCSIGTYAVNDSIISAGAFAARNSYYSYFQNNIVTDRTQTVGDITSFSSYQAAGYGPTGVALPTICAPGFDVVAAGSRYSYFANNNVATVMKTDDGSYWGVMTGTSMAAPTVAGIIALWLQANPTLCVRQVKEIIAETAIHDSFTTGANAARFGPNGKIDAMAGMRSVLDRMGFLLGDVDSDGVVGIKDLTALIDYLLGNSVLSIQLLNADVDCDGSVDIADATILIDALVSGREIAY